MGWLIAIVIVAALFGLAGRWLFKQRSPDEMIQARDWLRKRSGKR